MDQSVLWDNLPSSPWDPRGPGGPIKPAGPLPPSAPVGPLEPGSPGFPVGKLLRKETLITCD